MNTFLWSARWSTAYGYQWKLERECSIEEAEQWLTVFENDEQNVKFILCDKKPSKKTLYTITEWKPL